VSSVSTVVGSLRGIGRVTRTRRKRLLTIAHSYCVDVNRRLAHELALAGGWDVTAVGPARFRGDFGWHTLEPGDDEPCTVIPVPVHFSRPIQVMLYGRRLAGLLRQPWDLVHCWEEPYIASAAQVAFATPRTVPLVFATFQNIAKVYPPPFNWIERYTLARASGIIAFGQTVFDVVSRRGAPETPIRIIPPGVDVTQFKPDPAARSEVFHSYGWHEGTPVVGFLGRFVEEKGCRWLTSVLDGIERPWRALFVGSGPLESELRAWSRRHADRVRIETAVRHHEVPRYLNAMDLLCAPSRTTAGWREQFGRMLIEAFACGVPVVASDSGEIPHVVADAGLIAGERDVRGWTDAITRLLAEPALRTELATRGRQRAAASFAWPIVARRHLDFFEELTELPVQPAARAG
jgi:phosphatidylinositol alpha-1,6-mannosyltransferase